MLISGFNYYFWTLLTIMTLSTANKNVVGDARRAS